MSIGKRVRRYVFHRVFSQFHHPRGWAGRLAGWEMTLRPSNRKRNIWAVSLLHVQPSDCVLEIGFGPGVAVRELGRRVSNGVVVGIDHSEAMRAQAARRNARAIRAGRVSLMVASVESLPAFDRPFDKILAVNNMGMWPEPAAPPHRIASPWTKHEWPPDGALLAPVALNDPQHPSLPPLASTPTGSASGLGRPSPAQSSLRWHRTARPTRRPL
jgi:SAM-dependent methyltransferase